MLAILNRLVSTQEKQVDEKKESKRFTQFPSNKFDGSELLKSLDHWNIFMQYWIYVLRKGYVPNHNDANYYAVFCQQFILTLTGIAYTWFKQIQDNYDDIDDIKAVFLKQFNEWGQTVKQHMTVWNGLKFDVQKHDMDVFTRKLKLLASILYMTDDQTLEKFKDSFDTTIAAHLIECNTLTEATEKAEQLVFLYKSTNPPPVTTMLLHNVPPEPCEVNEHQLAPVDRQDKRTTQEKDKNRQGNSNDASRAQNSNFQRGQGNFRYNRGCSNQRGGFFREKSGHRMTRVTITGAGGFPIEAEAMIQTLTDIETLLAWAEEGLFKDAPGDQEASSPEEGAILPKLELETQSIKEYPNIDIFVECAVTVVIMIISVIHCNTWHMPYKLNGHIITIITTITIMTKIIVNHRLFENGIS